MNNIDSFMRHNSKYKSLQKPLEAANVCDTARLLAHGRFEVVSFRQGLLTLGVTSPAASTNLQMETSKIIKELNEKLGGELVLKIRLKII